MQKFLTLLILFLGFSGQGFSQIIITDDDLNEGESYTWEPQDEYLLDGLVFLEEGGTLVIEAGTVIKGIKNPTNPSNASSALIISRGATIIVKGEQHAPVIFTAEQDNVQDPDDLTVFDRGLWGGLIILGNAQIANSNCEVPIDDSFTNDARSFYGNPNCSDAFNNESSGELRYVSIRHAGAMIGENEINGLTFAAVGRDTRVDFVETYACMEDGIEMLGGTVSIKHAVAAFCSDDSFSWDVGWQGEGQFWYALQDIDKANNAVEANGAIPDDWEPASMPVIYNGTYVGSGLGGSNVNEHALLFQNGSGGTVANSIFTDFARHAIQVEDNNMNVDSYQKLMNGELAILNNIFWEFGEGDQLSAGPNGIIRATIGGDDPNADFLIQHLENNLNFISEPLLIQIDRFEYEANDPRSNGEDVFFNLAPIPGNSSFFDQTIYKGAFDPLNRELWTDDWTALSRGVPIAAERESLIIPISEGFVIDSARLITDTTFLAAVSTLNIVTQNYLNKIREEGPYRLPVNVITIPVVIHNLYNIPEEMISLNRINEQIDILNETFRRQNITDIMDAAIVPSDFIDYAADVRIQFELAKRSPTCTATNGVIHQMVTCSSFMIDNSAGSPQNRYPMKFSSTACGSSGWPSDKYLNIWVVDINTASGMRGDATHPADLMLRPDEDGIVIDYKVFGANSTILNPFFAEGKTLTQLVAKWLDLYPIWQDLNSCTMDDFIDDTPTQYNPTFMCPAPSTVGMSCGTGSIEDMFTNYMDNTYDICRQFFTLGQSERMLSTLINARGSLISSDGLDAPVTGADLWLRDAYNDSGVEPFIGVTGKSTDIWLRRQNDNITEHQLASVGDCGVADYVSVRIKNRGCAMNMVADEVRLNWAHVSTGNKWPAPWDGVFNMPNSIGGLIGMANIPPLANGDEMIETFNWCSPTVSGSSIANLDKVQYCFFSEIISHTQTTDNLHQRVGNTNNIALNNMLIASIIDTSTPGDPDYYEGYFLVGNYSNNPLNARLTFDAPTTGSGFSLFDWGEVVVDLLGGFTLTNWSNTGSYFTQIGTSDRYELNASGAYFSDISFAANEVKVIRVEFTPTMPANNIFIDIHELEISQYVETSGGLGDLTGTVTLVVKSLANYPFHRISGPITNDSDRLEPATTLLSYPNPSHDILHVEAKNLVSKEVVLEIFDNNGRTMEKKTVSMTSGNLKMTLNIGEYSSGIYYIRLIDGSKVIVNKVCVL